MAPITQEEDEEEQLATTSTHDGFAIQEPHSIRLRKHQEISLQAKIAAQNAGDVKVLQEEKRPLRGLQGP